MYAIVDIETTGGSAAYHKITEICILLHDGNEVIRKFHTLINPEQNIPFNITMLTGITNEMVADAPKFYEVAREIYEITDQAIFVAHNVNFDFSFLKKEFEELGGEFKRQKLCTVRLSRKLLPGRPGCFPSCLILIRNMPLSNIRSKKILRKLPSLLIFPKNFTTSCRKKQASIIFMTSMAK